MISYKVISTTDNLFKNKSINVSSLDHHGDEVKLSSIKIPDNIVLCDGCNKNLYPNKGNFIFIDGQPRDIYCTPCRQRFFPEAIEE